MDIIQANRLNPFLFGFILLILCINSLYENLISIFIFGVFWLILGNFIIRLSFRNDRNTCSYVFYLFYLFYLLYSITINYFYVIDPLKDYFYAQDSLLFYEYSNELAQLKSIPKIIDKSFNYYLSFEWKIFAASTGIVGQIANEIDQNNIVVQKIPIVFYSALILPYIYKILLNYLPRKHSLISVISYGIFSYSLFYSAVFIRDVMIGYLFILMVFTFFCEVNIWRFMFLAILSVLTFLIRPEHGIFSIIFIVFYFYYYLKVGNNKYSYIAVLPLFLFSLFFILGEVQNFSNIFTSTTEVYESSSIENAGASSLGGKLLQLPFGIKQIASGLFSQMLPFPFYAGLDENGLGFIPLAIAPLFWFYIWVIVFYVLISPEKRRYIDFRLWGLFLIAIVLILAASSNADTRRIMAVYPVIFIVSQIELYRRGDINIRKKYIYKSISLYAFLLIVFLMLKGG